MLPPSSARFPCFRLVRHALGGPTTQVIIQNIKSLNITGNQMMAIICILQ